MTWIPDACTLPTEQVPLRVAEFDQLFRMASRVDRPTPRTVQVTFDAAAEVEAIARDLIARESACCSFFRFGLDRDEHGQLLLQIAVPPGQECVLEGLAGIATGAAGRPSA